MIFSIFKAKIINIFKPICYIAFLAFTTCKAMAFVVGVEDCSYGSALSNQNLKVYPYKFDKYASLPDVSVKVTKYSTNPDFKIAVTSDINYANLALVDDLSDANMKVCKLPSYSFAPNVKTIKVSEYVSNPDIEVLLIDDPSEAEYVIYLASEDFSAEEAAALFPVIWVSNRNLNSNAMTAYQLKIWNSNGKSENGPIYRTAWECYEAEKSLNVFFGTCIEVQVPVQ